jgi:hypothetical protein
LAFWAILNRFRADLIDSPVTNQSASAFENVTKVFEVMRTKLGLTVETSPEEFVNGTGPDKFTVLMILDKLYGLFRNHQLVDVDDHEDENGLENTSHPSSEHPLSMKRKMNDLVANRINGGKPRFFLC